MVSKLELQAVSKFPFLFHQQIRLRNLFRCQAQADERSAILKEQLEARRQAVFDRVQREAKAEAKQNEVNV